MNFKMGTRVTIDDTLDSDIEYFKNEWKKFGIKNISKSDVLRILVEKHKKESIDHQFQLKRKPKSKTWYL